MSRVTPQSLIAPVLALALILFGAVSAFHMGPDRDAMERTATLIAFGGTLEDICADGSMAHEHDCPLCHKVPAGPNLTGPQDAAPLSYTLVSRAAADEAAPARDAFSPGQARAPPHRA